MVGPRQPAPALSLVLPCFSATGVAHRSVEVMSAYLPTVVDSWEIVVVDDGNNEFDTHPLPSRPEIRLLRHPKNLGKGAAVRTGMLDARGQVRVFTDVNIPYDRELVPLMAHYITSRGFHLAIGDRTRSSSGYLEGMPFARRLLSSSASRMIGTVVTGGFFDTQCGIKAIRGDLADALFRLVQIPGFAFDVELIYLALKHGLDIKRVPARLRRNDGSTVRPFRDAGRSVRDILQIKIRQLRGEYECEALELLVLEEHQRDMSRFVPGDRPA